MASDASPAPDLQNAALLIAAHGSPSSRGGRTSTRKLVQSISKLNIFAEVAAGFLTEEPFAVDVLRDLNAPDIYVVPNMTANGYITSHKLPQALSLTGPVTEQIGPHGHRRVLLSEPTGTHPLVSRIMANRIKGVMDLLAINMADAALVVVGHGSTKSRASFVRTEEISSELHAFGLNIATHTAYLEEAPFVKDWQDLSDAETIVFAPFLISDGFHASQDIPQAIGFDPNDKIFQDTLSQGMVNETTKDGRRIVYIPPVGDEPDMVDIVLARVRHVRDATV